MRPLWQTSGGSLKPRKSATPRSADPGAGLGEVGAALAGSLLRLLLTPGSDPAMVTG